MIKKYAIYELYDDANVDGILIYKMVDSKSSQEEAEQTLETLFNNKVLKSKQGYIILPTYTKR